MKKGCLIFLIVVLALLIGGLAAGYWFVSQAIGLREAPVVSHTELVQPNTRLIAVAKPTKLIPLIERNMDKALSEMQGPEFVKNWIRSHVAAAVPNEVALLGGAEPANGTYGFTTFINERLFGPLFAMMTSGDTTFSGQAEFKYEGPVFELPKRGLLKASQAYPIAEGIEPMIAQKWQETSAPPIEVTGDHLIEVAVDNRGGDLLRLLGAYLQHEGRTISDVIKDEKQKKLAPIFLALVTDLRFMLDLAAEEAVVAALDVSKIADAGSPFHLHADAALSPDFMKTLETGIAAGKLDGAQVSELVFQTLSGFSFNIVFENQSQQFLNLLEELGVFDNPDMTEAGKRQFVEMFTMLTEGELGGAMTPGGDLEITWSLKSKPENTGAVFITLGFLPIDQDYIPVIEDFWKERGMGMTVGQPTLDEKTGVAYQRTFMIRGFRDHLPGLFLATQ